MRSDTSCAIGSWLTRPTLSRRIAVAMALSLVAIQAQAFFQVWMLSKPVFELVGVRWLSEVTNTVAREVFSAAPTARNALFTGREVAGAPRVTWSAVEPTKTADSHGSLPTDQLAATLRDVLGDTARDVRISDATVGFRFPLNAVRIVAPSELVAAPVRRDAVRAGEPDVLVPGGLRIFVQGQDGTWVTVEPVGFRVSTLEAGLPYAPLLAGGLIIALVSLLTARRIMAPLDRLVSAAESVGTAREPVRVDKVGLHEFAGVAQAFEDMQQKLLRFVEDRTRILAAISHDLRSSLTRLRLAAEQCGTDAERATLSSEIDDMQSMVESTLAFASGEAQLAPNRPTDVAALLISLVDEASDTGKHCTYQGPNHIETMGHPVSLKRVFWNVIDNALKYGMAARIGLTVEPAGIYVTVDDDGPGILELHHDDVFVPFRRLDPARGHEIPGVGLGLTIARDVVQSHGGTITLANHADGGLRVSICLPQR
jgi:signal transduction histidine kinase